MSELSKKDSSSDVDSNSSWTLLTEDANGDLDGDRSTEKNKQAKENVIVEPEKNENTPKIKENELATVDEEKKSLNSEINRENDIESLSSSSACSLDTLPEVNKEKCSPEQGCPTLDEFLTDKELAHDYDYDDRAEFWEYLWNSDKRKKRKYKKSSDQHLTTMTVVGAVLSLAGLSLLCMISPLFARHAVTPDLQTKIEKNFTKIESPYTAENNLKVYVDKSNKLMKIIDKADGLEPYLQQCCSNHVKDTECEKACPKFKKANIQAKLNDRPLTFKQYLSEDSDKEEKEAVSLDVKVSPKTKDRKTEEDTKNNEKKEKVRKIVDTETYKKYNQTQETAMEETKKNDNSFSQSRPKKSRYYKKVTKEVKIKDFLEKSKQNFNKDVDKDANNKKPYVAKKGHATSIPDKKKAMFVENKKDSTLAAEKYGSFQNTYKEVVDAKVPNFVLVNKGKKMQSESKVINSKKLEAQSSKLVRTALKELNFKLDNKVIKQPESNTKEIKSLREELLTKVNSMQSKPVEKTCPTWSKPVNPPNKTFAKEQSDQMCDKKVFIACQILQDICMLRLTSKLKAKEKTRQKILKRRLNRRKLRVLKTIEETNSNEEEETEQSKNEEIKTDIINTKNDTDADRLSYTPKQIFDIKLKLVDNHFLSEVKPVRPKKPSLSNFDLLKELPFMNENKREGRNCIIIARPTPRNIEKVTLQRIEPISYENLVSGKGNTKESKKDACTPKRQKLIIYNEIGNHKSVKFLEDARRKNEERLNILEKMRQDNRSKIDEIIRERRERIKKDASLGIYNVPLPKYTEISEKLKQLKKGKAQHGFFTDLISSSDSEPEQKCAEAIENTISSELMTALKMGKKVSDTFRDWTLKKAPTLTCLKNYCNSKVSQITERLSSQSIHHNTTNSSLNKEELEALKCRKEKHEQLKKFWRAKQEYLDKRIEICELLKQKLSPDSTAEKCPSGQNITQGVQILDSIINDVLKSVRNSKSHVNNTTTCRIENEVNKTSKSVGNIFVKEQPKEETVERRIKTFSANSDDLYNWLFDKKAVEIRRRDRSLWDATKPGHVERKRETSKHDPSRVYHERINKKYN